MRLAHAPGTAASALLVGNRGVEQVSEEDAPSLLVSYAYIDRWYSEQPRARYRDWVLDSGAFTAWRAGYDLSVERYTETCRTLLERDETLDEVFALDDITSWKRTLKNVEYMWREGVEAIPTYHYGEPEDVLRGYGRDYPKVAVGGMALMKFNSDKRRYCEQAFARLWPKKVHGFAVMDREMLLSFPWHTVDASTWCLAPRRYGRWTHASRSQGKMPPTRGNSTNLTVELKHFLRLEEEMRSRWQKEMTLLEEPDVRA